MPPCAAFFWMALRTSPPEIIDLILRMQIEDKRSLCVREVDISSTTRHMKKGMSIDDTPYFSLLFPDKRTDLIHALLRLIIA